MPSLKCSACGLVNFASAETCKRCGSPMLKESAQASSNGESTQIKSEGREPEGNVDFNSIRLKPYSVNGMGVDLRAYKQLSPDTYQVTRCFTVVGVPLIPINNWVIRPIPSEARKLSVRETHKFDLLAQKPLDLDSVLRLYGGFLLWIAIAFAPFALLLKYMTSFERDDPNRPGLVVGILFLLSMPWCIGAILWVKGRRDKLFIKSKNA